MPRLKNGVKLCLALALVLSSASCRKSRPPAIQICLGDGLGGADCVERDGSKTYRLPSELQNYWMSNQPDMAALMSWCYDTRLQTAERAMQHIKAEIK